MSKYGRPTIYPPGSRKPIPAYADARSEQAKNLAEKWVDSISESAYSALINYSIRNYRNQ